MAAFLSRPLSGRSTCVPKIALPTRTIVAPSSIATSKSWLMPIDSSLQTVGRRAGLHPAVAQLAQRRNHGRALRVVHQRWQQHQARERGPAQPSAAASMRRDHLPPRAPCLVASSARSTWISTSHLPAFARRHLVHAPQQVQAVDRVNPAHPPRGLSHLVRLQMADQVPPDLHVGRSVHLLQGFLHLVLAEIALPGVVRLPDGLDRERLGHRDQPDVPGAPARPQGRVRDPLAHRREPFGQPHSFLQLRHHRLRLRGELTGGRELQVLLERRRPPRASCPRSAAPCRADSGHRRSSGRP